MVLVGTLSSSDDEEEIESEKLSESERLESLLFDDVVGIEINEFESGADDDGADELEVDGSFRLSVECEELADGGANDAVGGGGFGTSMFLWR